MTKFVDSLGLKRLVTKIAEAVSNGTWLPVRKGEGEGSVVMGNNTIAKGEYSHAEGIGTKAYKDYSHAEGGNSRADEYFSHAEGSATVASGQASHAEGSSTSAGGQSSHAEGNFTKALSDYSHTEGIGTEIDIYGKGAHAQGYYNYNKYYFIDMVGVGANMVDRKNASVIYVKRDTNNSLDLSDPKNGYQYLLGVGGYQGQDIAEGMKSVQEVIADLEKGVAASETMTVEEIREIMSA
jgi:hypothetical protein